MQVQWYPGHMFKAKKEVQKELKNIDLIVEVIDSRVPISSHNEMLDEITKNKKKLIVFTKKDLVNQIELKKFEKEYQKRNYETISISNTDVKDRKLTIKKIKEIMHDEIIKNEKKGINKNIKVMVIGMPNVGKSSFINFLINNKKTVVGNKPAVTKKQQWVNCDKNIDLLDTPGILIPKIEELERGYRLVLSNLIKDEVVELEYVAIYLLEFLFKYAQKNLFERYKLNKIEKFDVETLYEEIGKNIGAFKNNDCDYTRVTNTLINDFRKQKFGRIILDE